MKKIDARLWGGPMIYHGVQVVEVGDDGHERVLAKIEMSINSQQELELARKIGVTVSRMLRKST